VRGHVLHAGPRGADNHSRRSRVDSQWLQLGLSAAISFVLFFVFASPAPAQTPNVLRPADSKPDSPASTNQHQVVNQNDTYRIAQEVGPGSINRTDTTGDVYGADLGHMFTYQGRMYMTFGESFGGPAANPFFSVGHTDWRSNTMATVGTQARPTKGLPFTSMLTDGPSHARELLSSLKITGREQTVVPTYGISVGNRMYLYYMSIKQFDQPGHWTLNYSGIAYSDDAGKTWVKDPNATWPGNSNFGQVSLVANGGYVYVYGIPGGRYGSLGLARVPQDRVLDKASYQYFNGVTWVTNNPQAAASIVPAPVGELSVQYNSYYKQWLMMYLVDPTQQIVLRTAPTPVGPWGPAQVVADSKQYPELYAPYITPLWNDQKDIYFTMSMYRPYQVFLMHTSLGPHAPGAALPANVQPTPISPKTTVPHHTYPFAHGEGSAPANPHP
jgi:hypothetical protein